MYKIANSGRGPSDYTHLLDFTVDQNHVIVLSLSEILLYNKYTGAFVRKFSIDPQEYIPTEITVDSSYYYLELSTKFRDKNVQASVLTYDKEFNLKQKYVAPFLSRDHLYVSGDVCIPSNKGVFYQEALNDTIYKIEEDGLKPWCFFNVGKYQFTYDMYDDLPAQEDGKNIPINSVYPIHNICLTDDFLFFVCLQRKTNLRSDVFECVYSLDSGKLMVFDNAVNVACSKYGKQFLEGIRTVDANGFFYAERLPMLLLRQRELGCKLDERLDDIQEGDNPFLMKFKFRKF